MQGASRIITARVTAGIDKLSIGDEGYSWADLAPRSLERTRSVDPQSSRVTVGVKPGLALSVVEVDAIWPRCGITLASSLNGTGTSFNAICESI